MRRLAWFVAGSMFGVVYGFAVSALMTAAARGDELPREER